MKEARKLAAQYQLVISREPDVGYFGRTIEMPMAMGDGRTIAACAESVLEATIASIATTLERGERPPPPARGGARNQQVNIRLTAEERIALESLAAREGFRSISDYVRAAALKRAI